MIIAEKIEHIKQKLENQSWWESLASLIFPPKCGICGKLNENYLCGKCNLELQKLAEYKIDNYITELGFKRKYFAEHIYFFQYQGLIRNELINYKFNDEPYKYKFISKFILNNFILKEPKVFKNINDYDVIIPVPVSLKRFKQRGYNQAELIARQMARVLGKTLIKNCLYKSQNIVAQSTLNKEKREENIKGVYNLKNEEKLLNKRVLLVDDIYTTGSTANECCRVLEQAGTAKIGVLTVAKD